MTNVILANTVSHSLFTHSKNSGRGRLMGIESRSWLASRALQPPRGLSTRFGFRLAPTKLHQKSACHPPNRARRDSISPPPFGDVPVILVDQSRQCPQIPERRSHHFSPNLNSPLGFNTAELPRCQSGFVLQKTDAVFNAEPLLADRLCFLRRRRITSRLPGYKDQPQRTPEPCLSISLVSITR